jgi:hypothetical protein
MVSILEAAILLMTGFNLGVMVKVRILSGLIDKK